jgi:PAS domain S-box-containing protein
MCPDIDGSGGPAGQRPGTPAEAAPLSDAQLAAIVGLATDAIIAVDESQRITMFNDGAERIFGYPAAEVAGQPLSLLLPEALQDRHADHMRRFAQAPETARRMGERQEIMGRRKNGETFPAEASIAKLRTPAGWTFLAILRDVSGVHRRELQLSQAQAMAQLGGWEWDIPANAVTWTDELYRIYGLEPGAVPLSLETFMERLVPEDRATTRAAIEQALATGLPFDYEERIIRPDGAVRLLRSTGEVVMDAAGRPVRLVGVCQDITERRAAERKALNFEREKAARSAAEQAAALLRESEERFRTVADNAPVLIWMADADGRSHFFNRVWLEFTGRTREEEEGDGWLSGVHPDDAHPCTGAWTAAFASRAPFEVQYRMRRHDGQYRWLLHHGVPRFLPGGEFAGFIGSCVDITEQIEQQQALRTANEELAAARAEAERIAHRVVRLQQLTASLSQARTLPDVVDVVLNEGLRLLEANRGAIGMLAEDGVQVDYLGLAGFTPEAEEVYRSLTAEDALPAMESLRTGRPIWIRSADEYRRRYPVAWERLHRALTIETVAAMPLSGGASRPVGVLVVAFPSAAAFGVTDEAFTSLIGQVAGPAWSGPAPSTTSGSAGSGRRPRPEPGKRPWPSWPMTCATR